MVEDHPLDYRDFEGVIPEGNYGAGSVIIWDRGFYRHPSDGDGKESERLLLEGLRKGDLKFVLEGEKLRGEFALVKTRKDEKSWLLLKKKDRYATAEEILAENRSVVSGRTLEDVLEADPKRSFPAEESDQIRLREALESEELKDAPAAPMPHAIRPMLATLIKEPFDHPDWIFEVKWDGYRAVAEIRDGDVSLYSRNLLSFNRKFSPIVDALREIRIRGGSGRRDRRRGRRGQPDFQMLQDYRKSGQRPSALLRLRSPPFRGARSDGPAPGPEKGAPEKDPPLRPEHQVQRPRREGGRPVLQVAKEKGLEGIIAKHSRSAYRMGRRSRQWLKVKTQLTQEGVIAGFTEPKGEQEAFRRPGPGRLQGRRAGLHRPYGRRIQRRDAQGNPRADWIP